MEINNRQDFRPVTATAAANRKTDLNAERSSANPVSSQTATPEIEDREADDSQPVERIESVVSNLNEFAQSIRRDLSFNLQNDTGRVIVEVTDSQTGELIRKIPSEEALKIAERISEVRSLMTSVKA
ncbi:flagellar protein FlaG [Sessilibacter corallicola]|uniref:Flagellar protein FlaG n=1 Tax=Sessilibacter corallicola TaxID=2904075 RepID=A0ABQ0AAH4_9GAMM|nr:flagellar protein FlaG [Sessilibacter corallicola]MCE2029105.1 flagellar protein FlaG [Sessilibacter corallicola]